MQVSGPYWFIIQISIIIIVSYIFNRISDKTNIPSVILLIGLGMILQMEFVYLEVKKINLFPILEVLGIVGLILIVLEASLDLKLKKENKWLIIKSLAIAFISGIITAGTIASIFMFVLDFSFKISLIYAIPLSIMSSAIVIPSIESLPKKKKEFMIYESTFSDILGIMFYYFTIQSMDISNLSHLTFSIIANIGGTIIVSITISYIIIFVFQNIKAEVKLFLLISVLMLFYSIAKIFHISALLIILVFGLVLNNTELFFSGRLKKHLKTSAIENIYKNFRLITLESSFVVRTLFFVVFGLVISIAELFSWQVAGLSIIIIVVIFIIRYLILKLILKQNFFPELFIAPRGLISILLFFAIPQEFRNESFESGILLFIILISSILMTVVLIRNSKIIKLDKEEKRIDDMIRNNSK